MVCIEESLRIEAPVERCFDLARSIDAHVRGAEGSQEQAVGGVTSGLLGPGEFVRWRATHFGVRQYLASKITAFESPRYFQDTMIEGAFQFMQHDHFFESLGPNLTEMRDRFVFTAPLPLLGLLAEWVFGPSFCPRLEPLNEYCAGCYTEEDVRSSLYGRCARAGIAGSGARRFRSA
jgi:ligand-binding SRPBCC domain-containing protein